MSRIDLSRFFVVSLVGPSGWSGGFSYKLFATLNVVRASDNAVLPGADCGISSFLRMALGNFSRTVRAHRMIKFAPQVLVVSQLSRSQMAGVKGIYQVIVPSPERPGMPDCLMWVAMDRGVVAYVHQCWSGTPDEAEASMMEHLAHGWDEVDGAVQNSGWFPLPCAALDPDALEGEISSRLWEGEGVDLIRLAESQIQTARLYLAEFLDLLDPDAIGIWRNIWRNNRGVRLHVAACNLTITDCSRRTRYRQQAFSLYPWLAAYVCPEMPVSWSMRGRSEVGRSYSGDASWSILACIDRGDELISFLSKLLDIPAPALRRTRGLNLTALFKLEPQEFLPAFRSLAQMPGWKYLNEDGDKAMLGAHYWLQRLGFSGFKEDTSRLIWASPDKTLKKLFGAQRLRYEDLEEQGEEIGSESVSLVRDFVGSLVDGVVCEYGMGRLEAQRRVKQLLSKMGPRLLLEASDRWHERMRHHSDAALLYSDDAVSWLPLINMPLIIGQRLIVELANEYELMMEGAKMQHCVGSYANQCVRNGVRVFSIGDLDGNRLSTLALCPVFESGSPEEMFMMLEDDAEGNYGANADVRQVMLDHYCYESPAGTSGRDFFYRHLEHTARRNAQPEDACLEAAEQLRIMVNGSDYLETRRRIFEESIKACATPLSNDVDPFAGEIALEVINSLVGEGFSTLG